MRSKILRGMGIALALVAVGAPAYAIIGRPLTPVSFAGVARRTVRRNAYYGGGYYGGGYYGGAAVGTAAVGAATVGTAAAISTLPAGCTVGYPCGGVTYQPAYQGTTVIYVPR